MSSPKSKSNRTVIVQPFEYEGMLSKKKTLIVDSVFLPEGQADLAFSTGCLTNREDKSHVHFYL